MSRDRPVTVADVENRERASLDTIAKICAGAVPLTYIAPTPAADNVVIVPTPNGEDLRVVVHARAFAASGVELLNFFVRLSDGRAIAIDGYREGAGAVGLYAGITLTRPIVLRAGESLWATDYAASGTLIDGGAGYKDVRV